MLERKWPDQTLKHYSDGLECREPSTILTSGHFTKRLPFEQVRGSSGESRFRFLEPQLA
jgi:hypothetical protein